MKDIYIRSLFVLLFFVLGFGVQAQENVVKMSLIPTETSKTTVHISDEFSDFQKFNLYMDNDCTIKNNVGKVSATYSIKTPNNSTINGNLDLKPNGEHNFLSRTKLPEISKEGTYSLICKYTWKNAKGVSDSLEKTQNFTVNLYKQPSLQSTQEKKVVFSGKQMVLNVATVGGFEKGWHFDWVGQNVHSSSYNFTAINENTNKLDKTIIVKSINYGPDGKTKWAELEKKFVISIWKRPSSNIADSIKDVFTNQTFTTSVKTAGGDPAAWKYEWSENGKVFFTGADFSKSYKEPQSRKIVWNVKVTNAPVGMDANDVYTFTQKVTIYYWQTINVQDLAKNEIVTWSGEKVDLGIKVNGGNQDGWSFTWNKNFGNKAFVNYETINNGKNLLTENISLVAKNVSPTGKILYQKNFNYVLKIWPKPISNVSENTKDIFTNQSFGINVQTQGGDPNGWKYEWSENGKVFCTNASYSKSYNESSARKIVWNVKVTNAPAGIDIKKAYTKTHQVVIYYWKSIEVQELTKNYIATFGGVDVNLGVNVNGGNKDGWSFVWSNGIKNKSSINYKTSNVGASPKEDKVSLVAKNVSPSGKILYEKNYTYTFKLWPEPEVNYSKDLENNDVMQGDIVDFLVETKGGDSKAWSYIWFLNGNQIQNTTNSYTFNTNNVTFDSEYATYQYSVIVKNSPTGIDIPFEKKISFNTRVWRKPEYVRHSALETITCSGRKNRLSLNILGGYPKGWSYVWTKNGSKINCSSKNYEYVEKTQQKTSDKYTVQVTNVYKGKTIFSKECSFDIEVWPEPLVASNTDHNPNAYFGDNKEIMVEAQGGYNTGWTYEWSIDGVPQNNVKDNFISYVAPEDINNGTLHIIKVKVKNAYKDKIWYDKESIFNLRTWSKGNVEQIKMDSVDLAIGMPSVRFNSSIYLQTKCLGGYDKGWNFVWKRNGSVLSETKSNLKYNYTTKSPEDYNNDEFVLSYKNMISDNNVGCEGEFIYNLRIWAEANLPEKIEGPTQIRGGNRFILSVDPATGGYAIAPNDNWKYKWNNSYTTSENKREFVAEKYSSNEMRVDKQTYQLLIENYGPSNNVWDNKNYSHEITVYNQPQTPDRLRVKGNGTSRTLIAIMNKLNDIQLVNYKYEFVFGYTNDSGKDVEFITENSLRYKQFSTNDFHKIQWVYTRWTYSDGSVVTSGKRYLNGGVDYDFDGSSFDMSNRSPSDITAVENVVEEQINLVGNKFIANLSQEEPARLSIYTVNGKLIDRRLFEPRCQYNEDIIMENLTSGVYLVEVVMGNQRKVKKIYVH